MPAVSIIVPVHNAGEYLAECLASIECQSLRDIEVLCVVNGSTDDSAAICWQFAAADGRFICIELSEAGASLARNEGIRRATGDFLLFMDADDWYPSSKAVEKLYRAAVDHGARIAGGMMSEYDTRMKRVVKDYVGRGHLQLYHFDREGMVEYRDWQGDFGYTRFIFERKLIVDNGIEFPPLIRHEDPLFFVKAMLAAERFYAIPEIVYRYRVNYKPFELSEQALNDAVESHVQLLAIAVNNDLPQLKDYVMESLTHYLVSYTPEARDAYREAELVRQSASFKLGNFFVDPISRVMRRVKSLV